MRESLMYGSVRGTRGNSRPYRDAEPNRPPVAVVDQDDLPRQVAVLVANSTASALAAKSVTSSLPIVFLTGGDPVELGLIASLNRPAGNATGLSFLVNKLVAKRLELLSGLPQVMRRAISSWQVA